MIKRHWTAMGLMLAVSTPASLSEAQTRWEESAEPQPSEQTAPPPPTSELPQSGPRRKFNWALTIGVPVVLDVDLSRVRPGADLSWVGGLDIGYVVFSLGVGIMWTPINLNGYVDEDGRSAAGQSPVTRLYFFPEVRFQVPNKSLVLPYLSGAFDANWWNFRETGLRCGFFFCTTGSVYRFTPGFTGKVGLAFEINHGVHIDVGMKYSFSGKGAFFEASQWWLTPYVGVLWRRRLN